MKRENYSNTIKLTLKYFSELYLNENINEIFIEDLSEIRHYTKKVNTVLEECRLYPRFASFDKEKGVDRLEPVRLWSGEIISLCKAHNIDYEFYEIKKPHNRRYIRFWIKKLNNCLEEITNLIYQ